MILKLPLIINALLIVSACASTNPFVEEPNLTKSNSAQLTIYRPNTSFHKLNPEKPFVYIDDKKLGKLGVGRDLQVNLPKGKYSISIKQPFMFMPFNESNRLELEITENKAYYVRYAYDFTGFEDVLTEAPIATGKADLRIVDERHGKMRK